MPIAEEIENTQKYIEIQQMRFDYSFSVDWHLGESVRKVKCIKFLLQPILENSISHGLFDKPNGKIIIDIEQKENRMFVAVTDNGHGFAEERLLEIRGRLTTENSPVESIGLYNLNKRLILTYGEASAIFIDSLPEEKTTVYFSIPLSQPGLQDI
ncbi:MAG: sensor histidine kinase [Oscillospiraceae bacterium]